MEMSEEDYSSGRRMKIYIYIYVEKSGFIVLTFLSKNLGSRLTLFNLFFFLSSSAVCEWMGRKWTMASFEDYEFHNSAVCMLHLVKLNLNAKLFNTGIRNKDS